MTVEARSPQSQWRRSFPLDPRLVDHVHTWVVDEIRSAPLPRDDVRALATAVCDAARQAQWEWSHAERVQVELKFEFGAVEIRLTPVGDETLDHQAEWLLYRPS